jgi:glycosyltransferase involved in cell wall biosynthesis
MKVQLIFDHFGHHAGHSGYDQILRYLRGRISVEQLYGAPGSRVSEWFWERMTNHSGMGWYYRQAASLETAAALRILKGKGEIYHYLYGENSYRYLGYVRRVTTRKWGTLVSSYHQPPAWFEKSVTYKGMLRDLDAIVLVASNQLPCVSSSVRPGTRVAVIPHGIDTDYYSPALRQPSNEITCLCVGQWLRNFEMLRAVADCVAPKNPHIRFLVAGCGEAGEILKTAMNVTISGRLSDEELLAKYRQADMMVLPLTDSTANNALLEGIACGLPLVTTDNGGSRDYVDESCACLLPLGDADGMAEAVLKLADDVTLRNAMGVSARRRALTFRWENVIGQLIELYRGLAD